MVQLLCDSDARMFGDDKRDPVSRMVEIRRGERDVREGAQLTLEVLARMEMNSFFTELIPRIKSIESAGEPNSRRRPSSVASAPADPVTTEVISAR